MDLFRALIPVVSLLMNMAVQLLAARAWRRAGLLPSVLAGFAVGLAGTCALGVWVDTARGIPWQQAVPFLVVDIATYTALAYCYFGFINLGETSLRLRIFSELRRTPAGLSEAEMLERYNYRRMMELRLERLVRGNQVVKRGGRYFLEGVTLLLIAAMVHWAKMVVMGKASEFEHREEGTRAAN